jgi:hypothetical protein
MLDGRRTPREFPIFTIRCLIAMLVSSFHQYALMAYADGRAHHHDVFPL